MPSSELKNQSVLVPSILCKFTRHLIELDVVIDAVFSLIKFLAYLSLTMERS